MKPVWIASGLVVMFACFGCSGDDPESPTVTEEKSQFVTNTGVEDGGGAWPDGWRPGSGWIGAVGRGNDYDMEWTDQEAASGSKSLEITLDRISDENHYGQWIQTLESGIPYNKELKMSASIKTAVTGAGVAISVRGDAGALPIMAASTRLVTEITGDSDWAVYDLDVGIVPQGVDRLHVFLIMLRGTTGTAYFDDITLSLVNQ